MNVCLSRRVSWMMDHFGYGVRQRDFRRQAYSYFDDNITKECGDLIVKTVGSKGEGITNVYESDKDVLAIHKNIICLEQNCRPILVPNQTTVLVCNTGLCYYGHTFLEVQCRGTNRSVMCCLVPVGNKYYLSSTALSEMWSKTVSEIHRRIPFDETLGITGPAVTCKIRGIDFDIVPVLPCYCPSLLQAWSNRPRYHNWPSYELRQKVVSLGAVVAPTSHKYSINKRLEWRICFNAGETELVKSFNDAQSKLYILLKIVKQCVLKPANKEITSYVIKNIVFWLAELYPLEIFNANTLIDLLLSSLEFLNQAVKQNQLPFYMIPKRNLLAGKMLPQQRDEMLTRLDDAIHCGPSILLQCGRLGRTLTVFNPERLTTLGNTRNALEMLVLIILTRRAELYQIDIREEESICRDSLYKTCIIRVANIVLPDWRLLEQLGVAIDAIIKERLQSVLL